MAHTVRAYMSSEGGRPTGTNDARNPITVAYAEREASRILADVEPDPYSEAGNGWRLVQWPVAPVFRDVRESQAALIASLSAFVAGDGGATC